MHSRKQAKRTREVAVSDERPSAQLMAQDVVDGLLEAWIARFPRLTERGLRPRLSAALRALVGDVRQFSADDFDDLDVMAAALVEHFAAARSVAADLQSSPNEPGEALKGDDEAS